MLAAVVGLNTSILLKKEWAGTVGPVIGSAFDHCLIILNIIFLNCWLLNEFLSNYRTLHREEEMDYSSRLMFTRKLGLAWGEQ